jgi:hypothetical protein
MQENMLILVIGNKNYSFCALLALKQEGHAAARTEPEVSKR